MAAERIRVFLLDDHELVRRGVAALLAGDRRLEVVGEAATCAEAVPRILAVRPDVAVLDVRLPDGSGVTVCREVRSRLPGTRCMMLTSFDDDQALFDAIMAGASGYTLKQLRGGDLIEAIVAVAAGESLLDAAATARVLARLRDGGSQDPRYASLTSQERRIVDLIGEGLSNRDIGRRLFLAEKTVKNYVSSVLTKMEMPRRTQVAVYAAKLAARTDRQTV